MASETSGEFLDPQGHLMRLTATSPDAFRVLVTRKLAAGWTYGPNSPVVLPAHNETLLAIRDTHIVVNVAPPFVGDDAATVASVAAKLRGEGYAPAPSKAHDSAAAKFDTGDNE